MCLPRLEFILCMATSIAIWLSTIKMVGGKHDGIILFTYFSGSSCRIRRFQRIFCRVAFSAIYVLFRMSTVRLCYVLESQKVGAPNGCYISQDVDILSSLSAKSASANAVRVGVFILSWYRI